MITILIIIISVGFSFFSFSDRERFDKLKFNAYLIAKYNEWYRFISYGLIHADWGHLLINMWVLFSFGRITESYFEVYYGQTGRLFYLALYIGGLFVSTIYDYIKQKENVYYNAVGASGAVSAVVFSSILFYPQGEIYIFLIPVGVPAPIFGLLYLAYSAYMAKNSNDNIGHSAHFWGAIFGILFTVITVPGIVSYFFRAIF
jgi:membrane associated rhomboid family serine protease